MDNVTQAITEFLALAPKIVAFQAGQPVEIPIAAASYTVEVPDIGKVEVSEAGTTLTIKKG